MGASSSAADANSSGPYTNDESTPKAIDVDIAAIDAANGQRDPTLDQ
jgi:hypothetical protein